MTYFLIQDCEDGRLVDEVTVEDINELMETDEWCDGAAMRFRSDLPRSFRDGGMEYGEFLLIKGEIVVPKPVETVTKWKIDDDGGR